MGSEITKLGKDSCLLQKLSVELKRKYRNVHIHGLNYETVIQDIGSVQECPIARTLAEVDLHLQAICSIEYTVGMRYECARELRCSTGNCCISAKISHLGAALQNREYGSITMWRNSKHMGEEEGSEKYGQYIPENHRCGLIHMLASIFTYDLLELGEWGSGRKCSFENSAFRYTFARMKLRAEEVMESWEHTLEILECGGNAVHFWDEDMLRGDLEIAVTGSQAEIWGAILWRILTHYIFRNAELEILQQTILANSANTEVRAEFFNLLKSVVIQDMISKFGTEWNFRLMLNARNFTILQDIDGQKMEAVLQAYSLKLLKNLQHNTSG